MRDLISTAFHGEIEPIRETKLLLPTIGVEGIEILVFITAIYIIFFAFNKELFRKRKIQKKSAIKVLTPGMAKGPAKKENY